MGANRWSSLFGTIKHMTITQKVPKNRLKMCHSHISVAFVMCQVHIFETIMCRLCVNYVLQSCQTGENECLLCRSRGIIWCNRVKLCYSLIFKRLTHFNVKITHF